MPNKVLRHYYFFHWRDLATYTVLTVGAGAFLGIILVNMVCEPG